MRRRGVRLTRSDPVIRSAALAFVPAHAYGSHHRLAVFVEISPLFATPLVWLYLLLNGTFRKIASIESFNFIPLNPWKRELRLNGLDLNQLRLQRSCPRRWCSFGDCRAFRTEPGMDQLAAAGRLMSGSSLIAAMSQGTSIWSAGRPTRHSVRATTRRRGGRWRRRSERCRRPQSAADLSVEAFDGVRRMQLGPVLLGM